MFAVDAQQTGKAALSGRWSCSWARRRCNINVPLTCSTTHLFGCGTKPLP